MLVCHRSGIADAQLLYVIGQLETGGSERQLTWFLESLDRDRYRPAVVVWRMSEPTEFAEQIRHLGVPIYGWSSKTSALQKTLGLRQLVKRLEPDVVHSVSFYTNGAAWFAAHGTNTVAVGSVRTEFHHCRRRHGFWIGRVSACQPRDQIFNNGLAALQARQSRSCFVPRRISVIRNGLHLQCFRVAPLPASPEARILGIGSLRPAKRWDRLITLAKRLNGIGSDYVIRVIGDGPLRSQLVDQGKALGLDKQVKFLGSTRDVQTQIANCHFLVHCADREGCPNAVLEAMASGRAVVATDAGDVPEMVKDGRTGFVVRRDDANGLVDRIAALIQDRSLCARMGAAARLKAEAEFGMDRVVNQTLASYELAGWKRR